MMFNGKLPGKSIRVLFSDPDSHKIGDKDYDCPTKKWLKNYYVEHFLKFLQRHGLTEWKQHWDCDSFAGLYRAGADLEHAKETMLQKAQGIAVGEIWYMDKKLGPHSINVAITKNHKPDITFIEPQTGEFVILTKKEQRSIFHVRF